MTFDHEFAYSFYLSSSLLKKEGIGKGDWIGKNCDHKYAFQPGLQDGKAGNLLTIIGFHNDRENFIK